MDFLRTSFPEMTEQELLDLAQYSHELADILSYIRDHSIMLSEQEYRAKIKS